MLLKNLRGFEPAAPHRRAILQKSVLLLALVVVASQARSQGTFRNLDFEQATVPRTPVGGWGDSVDPALAFPGWTVGAAPGSNYGGAVTVYNNLTLGAPAAILIGPNFPNATGFSFLQTWYSALLEYVGSYTPPTLSQTGVIPADARSINFRVDPQASDARVTLGGVEIALVPGTGGRLAGDVTAFAGTLTELTFSTTWTRSSWFHFDDIRFSPEVIPEPANLGLFAAGVLLVSRRFLRQRC